MIPVWFQTQRLFWSLKIIVRYQASLFVSKVLFEIHQTFTQLLWRNVYKTHLHIQVNLTYVKTGGHVSDNLSGGTSDQRKNRVGTEFYAWKTRMDRMNVISAIQSVSVYRELLLQSKSSSMLKCLCLGRTPHAQTFVGQKFSQSKNSVWHRYCLNAALCFSLRTRHGGHLPSCSSRGLLLWHSDWLKLIGWLAARNNP